MNNTISSNNNIKKINIYLFLSILPLIIFGFYKNGLKLYLNNIINFTEMFKPLLICILGILIGVFVNIFNEKIIKRKKDNVLKISFSNFYPFYGLLIASIASINTNIILFSITTFIVLFISKFIKPKNINVVALTSLIIIFITNLIGDFSFLNKYEISTSLNLNAIDYFKGMGSGGINSTCIILLIFSLFILCRNNIYKKDIPLYSTITYLFFSFIYCIYNNNIELIFEYLFSNNIIFCFIYVASDLLSTPYTNKGKIIYSCVVGTITFILSLVYPSIAAIGGIIVASIFSKTIDKIVMKHY